jgi:ABC-type Fe3+/spermidine/putrescine transport system ATPase subunit
VAEDFLGKMAGLSVQGLTALLGGFELGPAEFSIPPGTALALVGPSGSGKTTLLRALAGFVPVRSGRIVLDGTECSGLAPERRGLGYVPQGLALFPHRTVEENVAYPMVIRGLPGREERVQEILETWGLLRVGRALPGQLSGGEQQRVAMARAMTAQPRALLWDEPLSALDPPARVELIQVVREALQREHLPMILVTHDPETAFSVASRFVLLDSGSVSQEYSTEMLCDAPPSLFAAQFVGYENFLSRAQLDGLQDRELSHWLTDRAGPQGVCFPAEAIHPVPSGWPARLVRQRRTPTGTEAVLELGGAPVRALLREVPATVTGSGGSGELRVAIEDRFVRPIGARTGGPA